MIRLALLGVALPMALCAAVLAAAWRPWRPEAPPGAGRWAGALAFGAAFVVAGYSADVYWKFPPHESWQWIVYLAAAAAMIGAAEAISWLGRARWPVLAALAGASALLLVGTWVPGYWAWRGVAAALMLALLAVLGAIRNSHGASLPLALCLAWTGASVILLQSENAKLTLLASANAASLAAATMLGWWRPRTIPVAGALPLFAVTLPGLLLSGKLARDSDVPTWSFVLAAAAPAALLVDLLPLRPARPGAAAALRVGCVAFVVAVAVAGALR